MCCFDGLKLNLQLYSAINVGLRLKGIVVNARRWVAMQYASLHPSHEHGVVCCQVQ
jgi:hypothetical protein